MQITILEKKKRVPIEKEGKKRVPTRPSKGNKKYIYSNEGPNSKFRN